jgi:hypothetical protein
MAATLTLGSTRIVSARSARSVGARRSSVVALDESSGNWPRFINESTTLLNVHSMSHHELRRSMYNISY